MLYQRSLDIERRLQDVLARIETSNYSTRDLADELGVSIPTISRDISALRERGHDIRSGRQGGSWRFVLAEAKPDQGRRRAKGVGQERRSKTLAGLAATFAYQPINRSEAK
jgi:biotin operon repressor